MSRDLDGCHVDVLPPMHDQTARKKLEQLIGLVESEHKAGRLTDQQRLDVIQATLKPMEVFPAERDFFMLGGSISEMCAKACGAALISKLTEVKPKGLHITKLPNQASVWITK